MIKNKPPVVKSIIAVAGIWCEVVCPEGALMNVGRGRSTDIDVDITNVNGTVVRTEAVECNGSNGLCTPRLEG